VVVLFDEAGYKTLALEVVRERELLDPPEGQRRRPHRTARAFARLLSGEKGLKLRAGSALTRGRPGS